MKKKIRKVPYTDFSSNLKNFILGTFLTTLYPKSKKKKKKLIKSNLILYVTIISC